VADEERTQNDDDPQAELAEGQEDVGTEGSSEEPQNRRARRAAASQARKQRLRERQEAEAVGLDAQEIIDDALVRSTDSLGKWLRRNSTSLQVAVLVGVAGWAGWGIYSWRAAAARAEASDVLAAAVAAERGKIGDPAEQGKLNEQKIIDPTPIFADVAAKQAATIEGFEKAAKMREGSGTSLFAQLALAGMLLDTGKFDEARAAYEEVKSAKLTASDPELRGRALEGIALVEQAKGDKAAAIKAYQELQNADIPGFVELALYEQARLHRDLKQLDEAKQALTKLKEKIGTPTASPMFGIPSGYLQGGLKALSDELGLEGDKPATAGANPITQEQLRALTAPVQEKINSAAKKAKERAAAGDEGPKDVPASTTDDKAGEKAANEGE